MDFGRVEARHRLQVQVDRRWKIAGATEKPRPGLQGTWGAHNHTLKGQRAEERDGHK